MDESFNAGWVSLLHVCQVFDSYTRNYGVDVQPRQVLDLLVADPLLHGSLCRSLGLTAAELDAIGPGPHAHSSAAAQRLANRLCTLIHYDWPDQEDHEALLGRVKEYCWKLHNLVNAAYIDYPIEDSPIR